MLSSCHGCRKPLNKEEQSVPRSPSFSRLDSHHPSQLENGDKIFQLALVGTNFSLELNTGADHPNLRYEDVMYSITRTPTLTRLVKDYGGRQFWHFKTCTYPQYKHHPSKSHLSSFTIISFVPPLLLLPHPLVIVSGSYNLYDICKANASTEI